MSTYEHVLFEAWIHGMITDNEFALAWQLEHWNKASSHLERMFGTALDA